MKKNLLNLEHTIQQKAQEYYEGNPTVTDKEFDELVDKLREERPESELLKTVGWGYNVNKVKGAKHNHDFGVVGSLDKVHNLSELPKSVFLPHKWYIVTEKLDGASCVAYYENGKLLIALSRGNGTFGIDVTEKFKKIISKYDLTGLEHSYFSGAIRGEIVMSNNNWQAYKELYPDAKFPRNVATGLMMRDDVSEDLQYIDFVTYKIHGENNFRGVTYYDDVLNRLSTFGFPTCWYFDGRLGENLTEDEIHNKFFSKPDTYPCDGFVIQRNDGITVHDNGWYEYTDIAYKFEAHKENTTVVNVEWKLSKNNIMVPVIVVEPVELSGAIVMRATGHNYKNIIDSQIGKGAVISLMRSGEVIPFVKEVVTTADGVNVPTHCPVCGAELVEDGVNLVCKNPQCPNIEYSRLYKWVEVVGVRNILGVGPAIIDDILHYLDQIFGVNTLKGLYTTLNSGFISLDISHMFTPAAAEKVKKVTKNLTTPIDFASVLVALNIQGLGDTNAKKLATLIYAYAEDEEALESKLRAINGIGDFVVGVIKNNIELIRYAIKNTVPIITPSQTSYKYQITVTGSLSVPREKFKQICEQNNILLSDNIKTSKYLITNNPNSGSSKLQKAAKLGIPILTEKDFVILAGLAF